MGKRLRRAFRLVIEAKADALAYMVQPLIKGACEMGLRALRLVGKIAERPRHLGQPVFQLRGPPHGFEGFAFPVALGPPRDNQSGKDKNQGQGRTRQQNVKQGKGLGADLKNDLVKLHENLLPRFGERSVARPHSTKRGRALDPHNSGRRQEPHRSTRSQTGVAY